MQYRTFSAVACSEHQAICEKSPSLTARKQATMPMQIEIHWLFHGWENKVKLVISTLEKDIVPKPVEPGGVHPELGG